MRICASLNYSIEFLDLLKKGGLFNVEEKRKEVFQVLIWHFSKS